MARALVVEGETLAGVADLNRQPSNSRRASGALASGAAAVRQAGKSGFWATGA